MPGRLSKRNFRRRQRAIILARDGYRCKYCFRYLPCAELHLDHVVPKCQGGTNKYANLVASCQKCQHWKDDRSIYELGLPDWHLIQLHPIYLANQQRMLDAQPILDAVREGRYATGAQMRKGA